MKSLFLCVVSFAILCIACSSEELGKMDGKAGTISSLMYIDGVSVKQEGGVLSFSSKDEFQQALKSLKSNQQVLSDLDKMVPLQKEEKKLSINGFRSIYDDYISALDEADQYYDSENGYKKFKEKYSNLYFPEYEKDYSAYLPVSDKDIAKLLDSNGDVRINGKIINMKDVTSYDQLVSLGETMDYSDISTIHTYASSYLNGFPELTNGGNRCMSARVYTKPGSNGIAEIIVVDIRFRKKGFLGAWYNYNSDTRLGWVYGLSWKKSGFSSHDYEFPRKYKNQLPERLKGEMFVDFQGFRGEVIYFNVDI